METNEDGFTRANVEAICATGKSSKKASTLDDHIGEKGFGFKSVFGIADEVHIQSRIWSFRFEHRQGENGLGMVTPLDAPFEILPAGVTTRITLTLSSSTRREHQRLIKEVANFPDTTIFFLQRLAKISFHTTRAGLQTSEVTIRRRPASSKGQVNIIREEKRQEEQGQVFEQIEESTYHVFTHEVTDMPKDDRRSGRRTAKIDLAFPVDAQTRGPKLSKSGQHVFAYLPLRQLNKLPVSYSSTS